MHGLGPAAAEGARRSLQLLRRAQGQRPLVHAQALRPEGEGEQGGIAMTAYNRGGHWRADFWWTWPDGRKERFRLRSPVNTKRGAERYERDLRISLQAGTYRQAGKRDVPTLEKFAADYIAAG